MENDLILIVILFAALWGPLTRPDERSIIDA